MEWKTNRDDYFRFCLSCSKVFEPIPLFCRRCEEIFFYRQKVISKMVWPEGFYHFYLMKWTRKNKYKVYPVIRALKGGGLRSFYQQLAWRIAKEIKIEIEKSAVLIPSPAKVEAERDHAYQLAKALGELWQRPVCHVLKRNDHSSQKTKTLTQRKKLKLCVQSTKELKLLKNRQVIFVDDIFTTGSTAKAAYKVLKKSKSFSVVTVFYRPPEGENNNG